MGSIVKLYHGSKGGINGSIMPVSRVACDFGKAFYLGSNSVQAFSICTHYNNPVGYACHLAVDGLSISKLDSTLWPLVVLSNRRPDILSSAPVLKEQLLEFEGTKDVIVGPIADDSLLEAFDSFADSNMTFEDLILCISELNLGVQYALKTRKACDNVEIVSSKTLYGAELDRLYNISIANRIRGGDIFKKYQHRSRRTGIYMDEFIELYKGGVSCDVLRQTTM